MEAEANENGPDVQNPIGKAGEKEDERHHHWCYLLDLLRDKATLLVITVFANYQKTLIGITLLSHA